MAKEYSEEVKRLLLSVVHECDKEDRAVRERQLRTWRRLKLLWEGFANVWYSETAHDWRIWDQENAQGTDQASYDKPVNVFRAYLESIIAALSITVPPVKCYPDDAEATLDILTARAGDKIAELVYRHNNAQLLWLHSLFVYCTEGMVACYSYPKESKEYGTYENKEHEDIEEQHEQTICSNCGFVLDDKVISPDAGQIPDANTMVPPSPMGPPMGGPPMGPMGQPSLPGMAPLPNPNSVPGPMGANAGPPQGMGQQGQGDAEQIEMNEFDEYMPDNDDVMLHNALNQGQDLCPSCMTMMDPELKRSGLIVTRLVGITQEPKSRVCIEAYGGMNVKIPSYARRQEECPYLVYSYETHYALAMQEFEHLIGNKILIDSMKGGQTAGSYDQYDQWARLSPQYQGEYPINAVTVKHAWLRPAAFNILKNDEDIKTLKQKFPDGAKVSLVNECFGGACNEALDDCWTIIHNPLADYVHYDPLGLLLVSIQEITNDLLSLTLQTIEHGIGQTFADPAVLNFKAYEQTEVTPGGVFPATPKSGKSLNDAFHEVKTASLSAEVLPFSQQIQTLGQLVSGALPSLFGGQLEGSETASQYSMSRAQSMQRLQNTWKMLCNWWKEIFGKTIPMYIKITQDQGDERDVKRTTDGNFINVFIRRAELEGKIGKVELEANENLPLTWSQQKDVVMQLLQAGNPEVLAILGAPENLPVIRNAIGLTDFFVPGQDEIEDTHDNIKLLLQSEPIPQPPDPMMMQQAMMMGMPPPPPIEVPSIQPDPEIDNPQIRFEICRKWLISEAGRQSKTDNEPGYRNVLLYAKAYKMMMMMPPPGIAPPQGEPGANGAPPEKPTKPEMNPEAPITGEANVQTIQ